MTISVAKRIQTQLSTRQTLVVAKATPKPTILYCKRISDSTWEQVSCEANGFYPPETIKGKSCNWTNGRGYLECSLPRKSTIKWIWVELGAANNQTHVRLLFNQQLILNKTFRGFKCFRMRLPDQSSISRFSISIETSAFRPIDVIESSQDCRKLGVLVGEIRISKHWWRNNSLLRILLRRKGRFTAATR